jgi:hypothetical protein
LGVCVGGGASGNVMGLVLGDGCAIEFSELTGFVVIGSWGSIELLSLLWVFGKYKRCEWIFGGRTLTWWWG